MIRTKIDYIMRTVEPYSCFTFTHGSSSGAYPVLVGSILVESMAIK